MVLAMVVVIVMISDRDNDGYEWEARDGNRETDAGRLEIAAGTEGGKCYTEHGDDWYR